jgi:hypothetical protein
MFLRLNHRARTARSGGRVGLLAFLGDALWVTYKHLLKRRWPVVPEPSVSGVEDAQPMTPMRAIAAAFNVAKRRHRSAGHKLLLWQLGMVLQNTFDSIANVV